MMAAAAVAATTAADIFVRGHPAKFQRLVDVLVDGFLHGMKFFLSIEKAAGDRIIQESFAVLFEGSNLFAG